MLDKIKKAFRWVYDWITILVASLVGVPTLLLQLLSYLDTVNIAPLVGPDRALQIVCGVALIKGVLAFLESKMKPKDA